MRVQVASDSGAYTPEIFCEMINDQVTTSKFSAAVGSTMANPQDPDTSSYAGFLSRESIQIFLTHATLHGVPVMAADVRNAYLQAPTPEKHFVICGPEFGIENI